MFSMCAGEKLQQVSSVELEKQPPPPVKLACERRGHRECEHICLQNPQQVSASTLTVLVTSPEESDIRAVLPANLRAKR